MILFELSEAFWCVLFFRHRGLLYASNPAITASIRVGVVSFS